MKRKRAVGGQRGKAKNKVVNDVINDEAGVLETNVSSPPVWKSLSNERTAEIATSGPVEKYPTELRNMIYSIIKEISMETGGGGGVASLSRSLDDHRNSNAQTEQPQADLGIEENDSPLNRNAEFKEQELNAALAVIVKTMDLDTADPFNRPVDPVALEIPDYFDVIDTPMDFGTVCYNLKNGLKYMNAADVLKDVQRIWDNCIKYNKKGDYILELMNRVKEVFLKHWIAAGLHAEQSSIGSIEPSVQHIMHNEEHSQSPVTPVAGKIQPNRRRRLSSTEKHHASKYKEATTVAAVSKSVVPATEFSALRGKNIEKDYPLAPHVRTRSQSQQKDAGCNQVAENSPVLTSQHLESSSQPESSPEQEHEEPATDSLTVQKKHKGRGPTRCLKLLNAVGRIKVVTNELGQPLGCEAPLLTSFLGLMARDGNLSPLTCSSWINVPKENKETMWQKVLTKFDIDPRSRSWVLKSLGTKWRNFKTHLKATHYDVHATDEERLADRDKRVLPDQWSYLVSLWSSEKWQSLSSKNKSSRARQKFNHTSGKKSFARIREEEKAKRLDGKELSQAELFILTRTRKNGLPVNEETAALISQLRDTETNLEQTEDDALKRVMAVGKKGVMGSGKKDVVSLVGLNATNLSGSGSEIPTHIEALRMVKEKNAEVVEMKEKLASVEETCSQMAAQMSAMMAMMANLHKASPGANIHNDVGGTLVPEPISTSNHAGPSTRQTRGRKKRA